MPALTAAGIVRRLMSSLLASALKNARRRQTTIAGGGCQIERGYMQWIAGEEFGE